MQRFPNLICCLGSHNALWQLLLSRTGLHKTDIRGIQDTKQIVDGKTKDIENMDKKGGSNIKQLMKNAI